MRVGLMADVHANLPALEAVLGALARQRVDRLLCLGDLVGYNAQPRECLQALRQAGVSCLRGNHDEDIARRVPSETTNRPAALAQSWTAQVLSEADSGWLLQLPNKLLEPQCFLAVHGCFLNDSHVSGYVTSTMVSYNLERIAAREDWPKLAFCGHTHVPMAAWLDGDETVEARGAPSHTWPLEVRAVIINPGSVGQPRDGNPQAGFAVVDSDARQVQFHRVGYDVDAAATAIEQAGLPSSLADRLRAGR